MNWVKVVVLVLSESTDINNSHAFRLYIAMIPCPIPTRKLHIIIHSTSFDMGHIRTLLCVSLYMSLFRHYTVA